MSTTTEYRHLGDVIRELREERGWSIGSLARRSDVDLALLSRLENHKAHSLGPASVVKLAQVFDISIRDLEGRANDPQQAPHVA